MITYPKQGDSFSIDTFRSSDGLHTLDYYIHVVNDKTGICQCQLSHFNYEYVMQKYEAGTSRLPWGSPRAKCEPNSSNRMGVV